MEREKEEKVVKLMIDLYCKKKHKHKYDLCPYCQAIYEYVEVHLAKCPHGEDKPFCANFPIHCYRKDMREHIRQVMRYFGPRMIFYQPIIAINHLIESKKDKKANDKE